MLKLACFMISMYVMQWLCALLIFISLAKPHNNCRNSQTVNVNLYQILNTCDIFTKRFIDSDTDLTSLVNGLCDPKQLLRKLAKFHHDTFVAIVKSLGAGGRKPSIKHNIFGSPDALGCSQLSTLSKIHSYWVHNDLSKALVKVAYADIT